MLWIYLVFRYDAMSFAKENELSVEPAGISGELWISPYGVEEKFIERMTDAKYEMNMRFYRITRNQAEQLMKNLSRIGVQISWIWENRPFEGLDKNFLKTADRMRKAWINVSDDEPMGLNFNHAKVIVADKKRFLIATANLTYTSIRKNREYRFTSDHEGVTQSLLELYENDLAWDKTKVDKIDPNLLICPLNCRAMISQLISSSKESIVISAQYIQDDSIIELLNQKAKEIDLQVLVWFWQDEWRLDSLPEWTIKILPDPYLHTKNIMIDDTLLIHGSMNLSENSLDNNREIGIVISDDKVLRDFSRQFDKDREKGTDYKQRNFKE